MMSSFYGGFLRSYSELPCGTVLMCSGVMCVVYNQEYECPETIALTLKRKRSR